jgi:tetratricopeptide (TPR) repeat protein
MPSGSTSLAVYAKALGPDHPDVARSLYNLANVYLAQRRYADAEPLHKRSLAIREKALGPNHPAVTTSLNYVAAFYYAQGRYADALPLISKTIAQDRANPVVALPVLLGAQGKALIATDKAQDDSLNVVQRPGRGRGGQQAGGAAGSRNRPVGAVGAPGSGPHRGG